MKVLKSEETVFTPNRVFLLLFLFSSSKFVTLFFHLYSFKVSSITLILYNPDGEASASSR